MSYSNILLVTYILFAALGLAALYLGVLWIVL